MLSCEGGEQGVQIVERHLVAKATSGAVCVPLREAGEDLALQVENGSRVDFECELEFARFLTAADGPSGPSHIFITLICEEGF